MCVCSSSERHCAHKLLAKWFVYQVEYSLLSDINEQGDLEDEGYRMTSLNLKVLAKFGLCSNCSQKLDECSHARARKIFATARMLGFSLKFPYGKTY